MDSKNNHIIQLDRFNSADYYEQGVDVLYKDDLPQIELKQKGIDLVSEYFSHKYQMLPLTKTSHINELIEKIQSHELLDKIKSMTDVRIPFLITGTHSTPVVYIKQQEKEYLLILDSLGSNELAEQLAKHFSGMTVYTSMYKIRQRDSYSCHAEAQILLRELTGKDINGNYLIPDVLDKMKNHIIKTEELESFPNLHVSKLFGSLLMTIQVPGYKDVHEEQYKSDDTIHRYKKKYENIQTYLFKYPPDEMFSKDRKPTVSKYLREKGLEFAHVIETQFYIRQIQSKLGDHFTNEMRDSFISAAKKELKKYGKAGTLTEDQKSQQSENVYHLAQTVVDHVHDHHRLTKQV